MFRFYRFIRRNMRPVPYDTAERWDKRLSFLYNFLAWNALGLFIVFVWKSKGTVKPPTVEMIATSMKIPEADIVRIEGFSRITKSKFQLETDQDHLSQDPEELKDDTK